jgi:diketogulonate reductase-like aldo/keto reductase
MATATTEQKIITLNNRTLNAIGQGTWNMGDEPSKRQTEIAALRRGIDLGLTLIDTAEMYGNGRSEQLLGEAIAGRRDQVFLTSKVLPSNASRKGTVTACERSLKHLATDHLDLYLLHWPGSHPLAETVAAFEDLRSQGKILSWGVSNFDVPDLEKLYALDMGRNRGGNCAANQILYNPEYRGPEFDLLPWCSAAKPSAAKPSGAKPSGAKPAGAKPAGHKLPIMAYSPVGQGGDLLANPTLRTVAARHNATTAQVALAWELRQPDLCVIPKAGTVPHVEENAAAADLQLSPEDLAAIDKTYPAPTRKTRLATL